jgi:acyl-CoA synthetase (AMP-forming)/AMP-acid ligase II
MTTYQTLGMLLTQQAARYTDKTFLYWQDEETSYTDFNARVNQVANGLLTAGIVSGEKVALLLPNCPEFIYSFFACARIGAVAVPINPGLKSDELLYILLNSESIAFRLPMLKPAG